MLKRKYDLDQLTPSKTVEELNRFIIGQDDAKRAVAIALRNRYRRSKLTEEEREEITPKNIILMGPTGVGKTEITRRIARLVNAPLIKVEATKFTEVGYVGRDVESMVRDLVSRSVREVQQQMMDEVGEEAEKKSEEILADVILGVSKKRPRRRFSFDSFDEDENAQRREAQINERRQRVIENLQNGKYDERDVTIEVVDKPKNVFGMIGGVDDMNLNEMFSNIMPNKVKTRTMKVKDARKVLKDQEAEKMIDMDEVTDIGVRNAEQNGIIFIDEIDKIIGAHEENGHDVSREGVQRDILPIVEGSTVNTKYGPVKTDFILFIGSGAFHGTSISDMIPELQGRFPINVRLDSLTKENFVDILLHTDSSIIKQYQDLLKTEGVKIDFTDEAVQEIASIAYEENMNNEDIGARRLVTVLEALLEDISFNASDLEEKDILIDKDYVNEKLDLSKKHNYREYFI